MRRTSRRWTHTGLIVLGALACAHCQRTGDTPAVGSAAACCVLTRADDAPQGKGRVAVASPPGADSTRLDVYAPGDTKQSLANGYGAAKLAVAPGTYDVVLGGKRVPGVQIKEGYETRIRSGTVHVYAGKATHIEFYEPGGTSALADGYGEKQYGFPVGPVEIAVAGQRETLTIEDGVVTDF